MTAGAARQLDAAQRREVAAWYDAVRESLPEPVRRFLDLHRGYLAAGEGDPLHRELDKAYRELRRALHLTPSSEKRRSSGRPLDGLPPDAGARSEREQIEAQIARGDQLSDWHDGLKRRHARRVKRLKERPGPLRCGWVS